MATNPSNGLPTAGPTADDAGAASSTRAVVAQQAAVPQPANQGTAAAIAAGMNPNAAIPAAVPLPNYGAVGMRRGGNVPVTPAVVTPQPALGQVPTVPQPSSSFPMFQMSAGLGGPSAAPLAAPATPQVNNGAPLPANFMPLPLGANPDGTIAGNTASAGGVPLPGGTTASGVPQGVNTFPMPSVPAFAANGLNGGSGTAAADAPGNVEVIRGLNVSYATPNGETVGGAGGPGAGMVGNFVNPQGVISAGFDAQQARGEQNTQQALDYINQGSDIFDRATRARAITGIMNATMGQNNQGAVQGQGVDSLNNAQAGIVSSATTAGASMYDTTVDANASLARQHIAGEDAVRVQKVQNQATPRSLGQVILTNPVTHMAMPQEVQGVTTYAQGSDTPRILPINPATGQLGGMVPANGMPQAVTSPSAPRTPIQGERRTVNGQVGEWNGTKWVAP